MSALDIAEIRARWKDVSPWPWQHKVNMALLRHEVAVTGYSPEEGWHVVYGDGSTGRRAHKESINAEAIAHAPSDVAALLAEVERLRALLVVSERKCAAVVEHMNAEIASHEEHALTREVVMRAALTELERTDGEPRSAAIMLASALERGGEPCADTPDDLAFHIFHDGRES